MVQAPRYFPKEPGAPGPPGPDGISGEQGDRAQWRLYIMGDHPNAIPGETYSDPSIGDGWLAMGDAYLSLDGGVVTGPVTFSVPPSSATPELPEHLVTKAYADQAIQGEPGEPGPQGPEGRPGGSYLSAQWDFDPATAAPAATGKIMLNAATYAATTIVYISELDRSGIDRQAGLSIIKAADQIMVQSAQGRAVWTVTATADAGTYRSLTVTPIESSGTIPTPASAVTLYLITGPASSLPAGGTDAQVLTKVGTADYSTAWSTPASPGISDAPANGSLHARKNNAWTVIPSILSGTAAPSTGTGAVGDYYLDTDDRVLYGPKGSGGYGAAQSVFTSQLPDNNSLYTGSYGHEIQVARAGRITGMRYYRGEPAATATHTMRLWTNAGVQLGMCTTSGETGTGWWSASFGAPITVTAGQIVMAVLDLSSSHLGYSALTSALTNGDLTLLGGGKKHTSAGNFPTTAQSARYFVDVIFEEGTDPWPVALYGNKNIIVLGPVDAVPGGTPAGTIIVRTT